MLSQTIESVASALNHYSAHILLLGTVALATRASVIWQKHLKGLSRLETESPIKPFISDESPMVTVLVAAWNEQAHVENFLRSYSDLDYPNKKLILVAGGHDETFQLASSWRAGDITVIEQREGEGKYNSLKRAFELGQGSIAFLTDADCLVSSENFRLTIAPIANGQETVVAGRIRPLSDQQDDPFINAQWRKWEFFQTTQVENGRYVPTMIGCNCAMEYSLLAECFESADEPVGEDHYFALCLRRAGHKIFEVRESCVEARFTNTFRQYVRQQSRWQRTWLTLNYRFGDRHWVGNLSIAVKAVALLLLPVLSLWLGRIVVVVWLLGLLHFSTVYLLTRHWTSQSKNRPLPSLAAMIKLMLADVCARAIVLLQLAKSGWRNAW